MSDTPAVFTELKLTDQIKELVNQALDRGKPLVLAYITEDGKPSITFRGTTQVYSSNQLAVWVRDAKSGLATAIEKNPNVALFYSDEILNPAVRSMITFRGRARIDNSEVARRTVYDNSHELERKRDPERGGVAIIIDLDSVTGMAPGAQFRMSR